MKFSVLGSSSRGNCTYVEYTDGCGGCTRILIDCGHSARQIERRLEIHGVAASTIDAILITHEHTDHIQGLPVFARKFGPAVYANRSTRAELPRLPSMHSFEAGEEFSIGPVLIRPFPISHDAAEPVGFVLEGGGLRLGVATDLGEITNSVVDALVELDALILESNYDPELLQTCGYPWHLQKRISSARGHLQNEISVEFLRSRLSPRLRNVVMAHISENSNTPKHVQAALQSGLGNLDSSLWPLVQCAEPAAVTPLIAVGKEHSVQVEAA